MTDRVVDMTKGVYRRIYAGYISGKKINSVSIGAEAWFWRLNVIADDFGNYRADEDHLVYAVGGRRRVSEKDVRGWMGELVAAGLITLYQVGGDRLFHINEFETRQPANKNGRRIRRFAEYNPADPSQVPPVPVNPAKSSQVVASDTDTDTDTKAEPAAAVLVGGQEQIPETPFDKFWKAYPKRVAKGDAIKAWKANGCDAIVDTIVRKVKKYAKTDDWTKEGRKFCPYPASWLNSKRWNDDDPVDPLAHLRKRMTNAEVLALDKSFGQGPAIEPPRRAIGPQTLPEGGSSNGIAHGGSNGK